MFQILKSHFFDPRTIRDEQLELTFIDLKNKIVVTDGRDNELSYKHLYSRIELVLSRILARHERYAVEVESGTDVSSIADLFVEGQGPIWKTPVHYPNRKLRRDSIKPELLFYLCFFAYLGGQVRQIGEVRDDPDYAVQLLDYLISEREFAPALFLKGFILKYGVKIYLPPKLVEAKMLLENAASHNVGGAIIELRQFGLHERRNNYARALARI